MFNKSSLMGLAIATAAMAGLSSSTGSASVVKRDYGKRAGAKTKRYHRNSNGPRGRGTAGDKLGRMAAEGKIGISRIR